MRRSEQFRLTPGSYEVKRFWGGSGVGRDSSGVGGDKHLFVINSKLLNLLERQLEAELAVPTPPRL